MICDGGLIVWVPAIEGLNAVLMLHSVVPTWAVQFAHVSKFAQGAVGLVGVPIVQESCIND